VEESGRNLSSGQKKILMIARALLTKKKIILLDEPFNELDNFYKMKVIALLNHLKTNHTIIIIDQCNHDALNYDNLIQLNPIQ
jgi:ABC-type bacteriocin/lantibiotic exporter with double-glycine peptidase domain